MKRLHKKNLQPLTPEELSYTGPGEYRCVRLSGPATNEEIMGAQGHYYRVPSQVHAEALMRRDFPEDDGCICYYFDDLDRVSWDALFERYVDHSKAIPAPNDERIPGRVHFGLPPWLYLRVCDELTKLIKDSPAIAVYVWRPVSKTAVSLLIEAAEVTDWFLKNRPEGYHALPWLAAEVAYHCGGVDLIEVWQTLRYDPVLSTEEVPA